jgi:hypothetical protein
MNDAFVDLLCSHLCQSWFAVTLYGFLPLQYCVQLSCIKGCHYSKPKARDNNIILQALQLHIMNSCNSSYNQLHDRPIGLANPVIEIDLQHAWNYIVSYNNQQNDDHSMTANEAFCDWMVLRDCLEQEDRPHHNQDFTSVGASNSFARLVISRMKKTNHEDLTAIIGSNWNLLLSTQKHDQLVHDNLSLLRHLANDNNWTNLLNKIKTIHLHDMRPVAQACTQPGGAIEAAHLDLTTLPNLIEFTSDSSIVSGRAWFEHRLVLNAQAADLLLPKSVQTIHIQLGALPSGFSSAFLSTPQGFSLVENDVAARNTAINNVASLQISSTLPRTTREVFNLLNFLRSQSMHTLILPCDCTDDNSQASNQQLDLGLVEFAQEADISQADVFDAFRHSADRLPQLRTLQLTHCDAFCLRAAQAIAFSTNARHLSLDLTLPTDCNIAEAAKQELQNHNVILHQA